MNDVDSSVPGIFSPEEVDDMRAELARGDIPAETPGDREGRAREILTRKETDRRRDGH